MLATTVTAVPCTTVEGLMAIVMALGIVEALIVKDAEAETDAW
jgi:hypothetical protein